MLKGIRDPSPLEIIFLIAFLLLLRLFFVSQDISDPYTPYHLKCRPLRGEKVAKCRDLREAVSYAANNLLGPGFITSIAPQQDPPRIIVGIANESYRALVPIDIMGIPVEVEVTGEFAIDRYVILKVRNFPLKDLVKIVRSLNLR